MEDYKQTNYQLNSMIKGFDIALLTKANKTEILILDKKKNDRAELLEFNSKL